MALTVLSVAYPFALVAPDTAGGAEQVLGMLDRALVAAGHRSLVIACEGSEIAGELIAVPRVAGELDEATMREGRRRHAEAIQHALRRFSVDVVHLHGVDFHHYLPPTGVPAVATLHLPLAWYPAEALTPGRPDTWLHCVSAAQHTEAPPHFLPPIENGVDLAAFAGRHARRSFALMLARICPEKGVHLAIDAAKRAGVPLLIAGQLFPYAAHHDYFATEVTPRLDTYRRWLGPIGPARKRRLLAAARCVLIPSLAAETSSLVAREAAAAGTPVVAFPNGALGETVVDGLSGFLVEDMEGMAAAIRRAGEVDRDACRKVARERFDARVMVARYFEMYATLSASFPRKRESTFQRPELMDARLRGHDEAVVVSHPTDLAALETEWWELWRACPTATPFQSPAWLIPWWRHFHPGELATIAVRQQGRLTGLAPFYLENGHRLLPLGISLSDYTDVLIRPGAAERVVQAAEALCWEEWELPELAENAAAWSLPTPPTCADHTDVASLTPVLRLGADLRASIPARQWRKLAMARHRAERRGGCELLRAGPELLPDLFRLHARRWGDGGVLADARVGAFLAEAVPALDAAGLARLYVARIGGRLAGAYLGFQHAGRAYAYLGGFDPAFAHESPGTLLIGHAIAEAIREGAAAFDFLRGDEAYKLAWGALPRRNRRRAFLRTAAHAEP